MPEMTIDDVVWRKLVSAARRRKTKPEKLADEALRDYLQRQADEDLLRRSRRAAQKTSFEIRDTEEVIRQHRKRKKNA